MTMTPISTSRNTQSLLKRARTEASPPRLILRTGVEQSPESAQFFEIVVQKYKESIDQILYTAKTFFIQEFQEVLFDASNQRDIEEKLASAPGLLI